MTAHKPATARAPIPPITVARTAPHHCAVSPLSNSPSSFDAPINSEFTALTRPRHLRRRGQLQQRPANDHADGVCRSSNGQRRQRKPQRVRQAKDHRRRAEDRYAGKEPASGMPVQRKPRHNQRTLSPRPPPALRAAFPAPAAPGAESRAQKLASALLRRPAGTTNRSSETIPAASAPAAHMESCKQHFHRKFAVLMRPGRACRETTSARNQTTVPSVNTYTIPAPSSRHPVKMPVSGKVNSNPPIAGPVMLAS